MFEGSSSYSGDQEQPIEAPFDYVAEAKRLREEREAKEKADKEEKAKRESEAKKQKQAKEKAKKSTSDASEKAKKLSQKAEELRDKATEASALAEDVSKEMKTQAVEMNVGEGSEYVAELVEGEEATLHFNHDELTKAVEQVNDTVVEANDEAERADAIARAREAINSVTKDDVPEHVGSNESSLIYDLGDESKEVMGRLKRAWGAEKQEDQNTEADKNERHFLEIQSSSIDSPDNGSREEYGFNTASYSLSDGSMERAPDRTSPITSTVKSGLAYVGGYMTSRTRGTSLARALRQTQNSLKQEIASLRSEVVSLQETAPTQPQPYMYPSPEQARHAASEQTKAEIVAESRPSGAIIPDWVKSLEAAVASGKLPELKKWQLDILKSQHPDLLQKYQRLDMTSSETINSVQNEKSTITRKDSKSPFRAHTAPGELPAPYVPNLGQQPTFTAPQYAMSQATPYNVRQGVASPIQGYVTTSLVGGVIFGVILIIAFGL